MAHSLSSVRVAAGIALAVTTIGASVVTVHIRSGIACDCWERMAQQSLIKAASATAPTPEPILSMTVDEFGRRYATHSENTKRQLVGRLVELTGEGHGHRWKDDLLLTGHTTSESIFCRLRPGTMMVSIRSHEQPITIRGRFRLDQVKTISKYDFDKDSSNSTLPVETYLLLDATHTPQGAPTR